MLCKVVGGTKSPGKEKSWERKFLGTKGPGNESSQVPRNEWSEERKFPGRFLGTKFPGRFLGMKSLGNETSP